MSNLEYLNELMHKAYDSIEQKDEALQGFIDGIYDQGYEEGESTN